MAVDSHKNGLSDGDAAAVERLVEAAGAVPGSLDTLPGLEDPYAVQATVVARLAARTGAWPCGYKLSFTLADPPATGLAATPAHGRLLSSYLHPDDAVLPHAGDPLVECELMVRARHDLGADATTADLVAGLEACAMLEVPVSRFAQWWPEGGAPRLSAAEFVADSCLAAHVVLGSVWVPVADVELANVTVELTTPDGEVLTGSARTVMGNPLLAVRWLLDRVGRLPAGEVVATGTMTPAVRARPGRHRARFSPPFGEVTATFGYPSGAAATI